MPSLVKSSAWEWAVGLLARWLVRRDRIDVLIGRGGAEGAERGRFQHLFFGAVRHAGRLEAAINRRVAKQPRPELRAVLMIAGAELIESPADPASRARIVHPAVEAAKRLTSAPEAGMANAVLRRMAEDLAGLRAPGDDAPASAWAEFYSHPEWLVSRWKMQFGTRGARSLLEWSLQPARVHGRVRVAGFGPDQAAWLRATPWEGFVEVTPGHWAEAEAALAAGRIYIQDPATRLPVQLLAPKPGEAILDLCAAPGGKSLMIADAMAENGSTRVPPVPGIGHGQDDHAPLGSLLVAIDLPGPRLRLLEENLTRASGVRTAAVGADLREAGQLLRARGLPAAFAGVLIDAPCTNSGVMRHRVDVKWRLREDDFARHARQQLELLRAASALVGPGGRLVYSTCSIDAAENEEVAAAFAQSAPGFRLLRQILSRPWESGHDGAGAFLFVREPDRRP